MPPRSVKMNAAHLRVPAAGLVAEVDSGLQELSHGDDSHDCFSLSVGVRYSGGPGAEPASSAGTAARVHPAGSVVRKGYIGSCFRARAPGRAPPRGRREAGTSPRPEPRHGMREREAGRVEELALQARSPGHAVDRVARHGQADRRQVDADLVRAAGLETDTRAARAPPGARRPRSASRRPSGESVSSERRVGSRRSRPIGASMRPRRERGRPRTSARYSRSSAWRRTSPWRPS